MRTFFLLIISVINILSYICNIIFNKKNMRLQTSDNVFMSFEYKNLFGLIRISSEAIYVHSVNNKKKGDGSFNHFMRFLENSKKPIVFLEVRNKKLENYLKLKGYKSHSGKIKGVKNQFNQSLIKEK